MSPVPQRARSTKTPRSTAISVAPWLRRLEHALDTVRRRDSPEGAHQLRVASARVRVWLELAGQPGLCEALKQLRETAAPLRNLDAQLKRGAPEALTHAWAEERVGERAALVAALESSRPTALIAALRELPPLPRAKARAATRTLASRALGVRVESESDLHELRRRIRRLRYALEWQGRGAAELERAQGALGEACDLWVTLELSRGHHQKHFRRQCRHEAKSAQRAALKAWAAARPKVERLAVRRLTPRPSRAAA